MYNTLDTLHSKVNLQVHVYTYMTEFYQPLLSTLVYPTLVLEQKTSQGAAQPNPRNLKQQIERLFAVKKASRPLIIRIEIL